ncbi:MULTISPECIES: sensor histidine kinase [Streptomyces]|uniref:histidine kinase n=1 Tax=Streptomyces nigrescens TaxID=1920 RepID=A0ABY7IHM9_STRNI|nr:MULTISPECIES: sensor histidine kinase [Streptomyces]MCX5449103.1 sensor domain-containing protein [Streptomyces libani]MYT15565.1 sensor histidine kinase [Streptomyces sp. SID4951]WAT98274.1 sensor domain-containing protein [Streptomyces libani subsp. libani]SCK22777.1 Signal transduction histidine kinase [Streptomyces sp. SceaMP-e96]
MDTAYAAHPRGPRVPVGLSAPFSGRTWREFLYLFLSLPMSVLMFVYAITVISLGAGLLVTFLGIPVLAGGLAGSRALGGLERARARALLGLDVADPEPARASKPGLMGWVGAVLKSGVSWRHLVYSVLHMPWAVFSFVFSVTFWSVGWALLAYPLWRWTFLAYLDQPGIQMWGDGRGNGIYLDTPADIGFTSGLGLLLVLAGPWVIHGLTQVDRVMVHGLLGPSSLATRVSQLESDRGVVVDTAAADLRRIERDLHDGAQARLAALAMDLGLAKEKLAEDPEAAARMVDEAHGEVKIALQELRDLARGIHPAILTDRGLGPALSALSARCTVPVTVTVDLDHRPAAAIEGIAYFTASELLQNVSRHARATSATLDVWRTADRLMVLVADNGGGGAHTGSGTGLAGLAERLDAVDGLLIVDSPVGGPTSITAELPWRG